MNLTVTKGIILWATMVGFLLLAFLTKDDVNGEIFAMMGIITGAIASKQISTKKITPDEKH
ncbi:MAG: hypothetical protein EBS09_06650 [Flavobacteriia bacterium]|nr:hypothetical protein [Flavobacteriia bacterium]